MNGSPRSEPDQPAASEEAVRLESLRATTGMAKTVLEELRQTKRLGEDARASQEEQRVRHGDVSRLVEILDRFGPSMPRRIRKRYFLAILRLLEARPRT